MRIRMRLTRYLRPFLALPELLFVLALIVVFSILKMLVPPQYSESLGWTINLYQVFAVCTALAWFMLPGALLVRILGVGVSWLTRLPTYFAAAVGVWVVPTLYVAFSERYSIEYLIMLGVIMTALLALAAYLRELLRPSNPDAALDEGRTDLEEPLNPLLVLLSIVILISAVVISFTAPVALDDNLQVMYVQDHLVMPRINEFEPVFGAGISPQTRGSLTTWPLNLTVMTYLSGLPPQQAFWLLRTPLVLLDLLAVYALSLQLFGKRNLALFCVAFYFILTLIYTNDADGIGFGLYARGAQDKFVARYSIFPIALAWSMAYLKKPNYRAYWLAGACTIGLATTHPIGVVLLGIPLGGVGLMHLFNHITLGSFRELRKPGQWIRAALKRNWIVIQPLLLLSIFSLIGVIVPLLQQASPDAPIVAYSLTDTRDPTLWFRINLAVNSHRIYIADYLGPGAYIVHPSVFLDAYILIPLIGLPVLFIFWRKRWVSELIIGTFLLNPAILLIPPVIQFIGSKATPWLLYRFAWPLSLLGPLAMCWAVWSLLVVLRRQFQFKLVHTILPAFILMLTAAMLNQEIDRGLTILSEQRDESVGARCRTLQPLFSKLPELVGDGTVVLAAPEDDLCIVSSSAYAYPVEFGLTTTINRFPASRVDESIRRMNDVLAFIYADVVDQDLMDILTRWNVGLILLRADHPLISQLQSMPQFFKLELIEDHYKVFRVLPGIGTDILQEMPIKDRWKVAHWKGDDALVAANTSWSEERWEDAIASYELIAQQNGDPGLLDLIGLGRAQLSAGQLNNAATTFLMATDKYPDSVQAWMLLGSTRLIESDYSGMVHAYQQILKLIDWHPLALSRLADAYRYQGELDLARTYYERAVAADTAPGTSLYYRALGSVFLEINWNEEAIIALNKSLSIRQSLLAYSLLSQVHLNVNDLKPAEDVAYQARDLDYWSDVSSIILGRVQLAELNFAGAVENFKAALANNPQSSALNYLISTLSNVQDHQTAFDQVTELIGYKLGFAEPVLAAAQMQFALGHLNEAIDSSERAYNWKPVDPQAADILGNIHLAAGNWDQAHKYFTTALMLNPSDHTAYAGLTSLAQMKGQSSTALGWSWGSIVSTPYNSDVFIELGLVSEIQGETNESLTNYQLAIDTGPYNPRSYITMGEFQSDQTQFDSAIRSFNQAIEIKPDATSAYRGLTDAKRGLGLFTEALQMASQAVQLHPAEGPNRISVSQGLAQADDYTGAINTLQQSTWLDPGYRDAYLRLGNMYTSLGMTSEAEAIYTQLIQVMPFYEDGYLELGSLYERQGDLDKATAIYQTALKQVAPHISGNILLAMANLLRRQGDFEQALELYQTCIAQQPMLTGGYSALSGFYVARGDLSSARQILDQGLALMPTSPILNIAMANVQISQGEGEQAEATYEQTMSLAPDPALSIARAQLAAMQGQPDQALAEIMSARQRWAGDASVLVEGTALAIRLGKPAEAVQMALDLVAIAPGYASTWTTLGNAYAATAQFDLAELAFRKAIAIEPGDSYAELALGRFLDSRGETVLAKQAFARAMQYDRTDGAPHLLLAGVLMREGNTEMAISELQTATDLDATQNTALLTIGQIHQQEGDFTEAQRYFQLALDASPLDPDVYLAQAQTYLIQGNADAAHQALLTATQVASGDCRAYIHLADYLSAHGEYSEAEQAYQQALERVGCIGDAHLGLGIIYQIQGFPEQAIDEFLQTMAVEPGNALGYVTAARYFSRQARLSEAETAYQNGIAALPASGFVRIAYSSSLINSGKIEEGILAAQESVRLAPGSASYLALGKAFQESGQYEKAKYYYTQASQVDRSESLPFLYLGDLSAKLTQFSQAESDYHRAIELSPTNPQAYVSLGSLLLRRGQVDEALQVLEQGIAANRDHNDALMTQIRYYLLVGKFDEASTAISRAFAIPSQDHLPYQEDDVYIAEYGLEPEFASLWIALGDLYRLQTDWSSAEAAYQQAISTTPGLTSGYVNLGKLYQAQGKYPEAREQFEHAIALAPGLTPGYLALGDLLTIQADFPAAEQAFQQAIAASPGQVEANIQLGNLYITLQRNPEAREQFEMATRIAPTSPDAWVALGDWFSSQAYTRQAWQAYHRAIDISPADPIGYVSLGEYLQTMGKRGAALAQFREAISIAPYSKLGYLALANWFQLEGNWTEGESYYNKAQEVDSTDIDSLLGLGYIYMAQKRSQDSLSIFQAAQAFLPSDTRTYLAVGDWYRSNINTEASRQEAENELANALALFQEAEMNQEPDEFIEYLVTGVQNMQDGQTEEAYDNFEAAIAADPNSVLPYLAMGQWYRVIAGLKSAEQAYQSASEFAPGDIQGILSLGELYLATGRSNLALEQFQKAAQLAPGLALPHIYIADWYMARYDLQAAETEYLTAIAIEPGELRSYIKLAQLYETQGRHAEAVALLETALNAGLPFDISVCAPGQLPSPMFGSDTSEIFSPYAILSGSWYCQWDRRAWSSSTDSSVP